MSDFKSVYPTYKKILNRIQDRVKIKSLFKLATYKSDLEPI